ncbi:hypothetical protein E3N88_06576 [Mikania micrantha]|uniref:Uncharacterized protein n=1 Tax=Mikania micrantha TaxID=192012 RepID=A0A5N6PRH1_9ASTR|nr:hypothetical protein E3N88_06576 [Mikania micrantha]
MMREFTRQKDTVRPAKTRFATAFITLNCFKANKKNLRKMCTSEQWNKRKFSKESKEMIFASFKPKVEKFWDLYKIIDDRWNCQLHQPLHTAGYYLNPSLYYSNPSVDDVDELVDGFMSCINKLALKEEEKEKIHMKLPLYQRAERIFGNPMAKKMRSKLAPGMLIIF